MTVDYEQYRKDKIEYFAKHKKWSEPATNLVQPYRRYLVEYPFKDGAHWYESRELVERTEAVRTDGWTVLKEIWKIEYWTTEQASKTFYMEASI